MSDVNFDLFQSIAPASEADSVSSSPSTSGTGDTKDTMVVSANEQSQEDARTKGNMAPWLPPPSPIGDYSIPDITVKIESLKMLLLKTEQEVIKGLFDKWDESIKEINEEQKKRLIKELKGEVSKIAFFAGGNIVGTSGDNPAAIVATTALLLLISSSTTTSMSAAQLPGFSSISDISNLSVNLQFLPVSFQPSLLALGGILAAVSFYPAIIKTLQSVQEKNAEVKNLGFALNYLNQVVSLVNHPALSTARYAVDPKVQRFIAASKLGLLLTSLALYYKAETGWLTAQEIGGLLKGEITLEKNDPRQPVIAAIFENLNVFSKEQRSNLLEAFLSYFDSNPSMDDLLVLGELLKNSGSETDQKTIRFLQNAS